MVWFLGGWECGAEWWVCSFFISAVLGLGLQWGVPSCVGECAAAFWSWCGAMCFSRNARRWCCAATAPSACLRDCLSGVRVVG